MNRIILLGVIMLLVTAGIASAADPNLAAHWKFDEGSGTTAYDSALSNHGTVRSANWTSGLIDGALDFDGSNDYVDVADSAGLSFTDPGLTISAWVYLNQDQSGARAIVRKNNQWQLGIYPADNTIRNLVNTDGTTGWTAANDESYTINTDTWYFFAFTYNGSVLKHYANGAQVGSDKTVTGDIVDNSNKVAIGSNTGGGSNNVNGIIDDVRIYDRALSTEEIQQLITDAIGDAVDLEITGPEEVFKHSLAQYEAIVHYESGHTNNVTTSVNWSVQPQMYASIDGNGLLQIGDTYTQENISVYAECTIGGVTLEAEMMVHIHFNIWHVPADYETIQEAIDTSVDGDIVIVAPGTYYESINFNGKDIVVTSEEPSDPTIVDRTVISAAGIVVTASNGSLLGFTIQSSGGYNIGIYCKNYSPIISHCHITAKSWAVSGHGSNGISTPVIENNFLHSGGGIYLFDWASGRVNAIIRNNAIVSNEPGSGTGIRYRSHRSVPTVTNNIIVNWGTGIGFTYDSLEDERKALITYNNVWGNNINYISEGRSFDLTGIQGNISEDPLFFNSIDGDFHLLGDSPCINAGDPNFDPGPNVTDIDGDPRVLEGRVDIGADEYNSELGVPIGLEIIGPNDVVENSPAQYTAIVFYEDGSTRNVRILAIWSVEPETYGSIDENGLLWTSEINEAQDITISAQCSIGGVTVENEMIVHVHLSNTWYVPADYETIQAAIDAAEYSDTIIVADGTYTGDGNRDIDFLGKAITLRSENGPENCIIDCNANEYDEHRGFYFHNGEDANSVLDGFTIIRGVESGGAGIFCIESSPIIRNCNIYSNATDWAGGGIWCRSGSSPKIINCKVMGNKGEGFCLWDSRAMITNCTVSGNTGGIICMMDSNLIISNSIVWDNSNHEIGGWDSVITVTYSNIRGGWEGQGNIDVDPLLTLDGHLSAGSPCIDAGDPNGDYTGQVDIDGEPRIAGTRIDMGADELLDADVDGLPDWWEVKYFGSATAAEPNGDPDMDGITNLVEYELYSSDPTIGSVTYYVNAEDGNDSYDGLTPAWDGQHGPKRTIQAGINTAIATDTVIVAMGQYVENINFEGKAITVRSSSPRAWDVVENTIIDGNEGSRENGSCVVFNNGEGNTSVLEGFTLTNGVGTDADYREERFGSYTMSAGGGILCLHSSPTIRWCNIRANGYKESDRYPKVRYGGGIALLGSCRATISNCFIVDNEARWYGGGIIISTNTPETARSKITNCTIANNKAYDINYVHYENYARYQVDCYNTRPIISNTIIWSEDSRSYQRCLLIADPSLVRYSCVREAYIFGNHCRDYGCLYDADPCDLTLLGGNISEWPRFVQPLEAYMQRTEYHLLADSPCIDAGDPNFVPGPDGTDIDGQPRVMAGRVDMGADEVVPEIVVTEPEGGEVWTAGSTHEVQWSSYGAGEVDILLSKNAGGNWQSIKKDISDTGSYGWRILNKYCSEEAQVKVVPSEADANVICIESGVFEIVPYHGPASVPQRKKEPRYKPVEKYGPEFGCVKWKFETDGPVTAGVTIGREIDKQRKVYASCEDGKLYALDLETGSLLWSYDVNSALVGSAAEGLQGSVYVGGRDGRLYAIDKNGGLLWTHSTDAPIYSSAVVSPQEQIYVCSEDGMLYALRRNGSEVWRYETSGFAKLDGSIFATLQIGSDGTVYIAGLYDPNLYALNPKDGSVKWRCNFAPPHDPCSPSSGGRRSGWPFAPPAIAPDGTIYQTLLYDPNLYAVEPDTGTIIWSTDLAGTLMWYKNFIEYPYWYTREVFIWYGSGDPPEYIDGHELYLIGRHKHAPSWASPALGPDGTVYVSFDDPYLRAVDPDGNVKWATRLGMVGGLTVTVGDDGLVYAASTDNKLYVVEPTGEEVARFEGDGWLSHPTIAPGHTIIVSDANNTVWAITQEDCGDKPIVLNVPPDGNEP